MSFKFTQGVPSNIDLLVQQARDKSSWQNRLAAVEELRKWKCQQSIDVLTRLAKHDLVFKVKEEAFRGAQAFGVTINGQPIRLVKKPKGHLIKGINNIVYKIANRIQGDFDITQFKILMMQQHPEAYDVYQYEKGDKFDEWVLNVVKSRPTIL